MERERDMDEGWNEEGMQQDTQRMGCQTEMKWLLRAANLLKIYHLETTTCAWKFMLPARKACKLVRRPRSICMVLQGNLRRLVFQWDTNYNPT